MNWNEWCQLSCIIANRVARITRKLKHPNDSLPNQAGVKLRLLGVGGSFYHFLWTFDNQAIHSSKGDNISHTYLSSTYTRTLHMIRFEHYVRRKKNRVGGYFVKGSSCEVRDIKISTIVQMTWKEGTDADQVRTMTSDMLKIYIKKHSIAHLDTFRNRNCSGSRLTMGLSLTPTGARSYPTTAIICLKFRPVCRFST